MSVMHHELDQLLPVQFATAAGQSTCAEFCLGLPRTYVNRGGQLTEVGGHAVRAERDDYADEHYKHTIRGGLNAGIDEVGAIGGTPAVGVIGQSMSDGHYGYAG